MNYRNPKLPLRSPKGKPKVGWVLAGGGARGFAYVGIYEILLKNNIPIDIITGTSMGSCVASFIACGLNPDIIRKIFIHVSKTGVITIENFTNFQEGLFNKTAFAKGFYKYLPRHIKIENLNIPFGCVAVNLETQKIEYFTKGELEPIIGGSSSIPLFFTPEYYDQKYLIDGGIINNAPADLARKIGAEKLIIIDPANTVLEQKVAGKIFKKYIQKNKSIFKANNNYKDRLNIFNKINNPKEELVTFGEIAIAMITLASHNTTEAIIKKSKPDLILEPLVNVNSLSFDKQAIDQAYQIGKEYALKNIDKIKAVIEK